MLWGECISGALYKGDFIRLAQQVGFQDPRSLSSAPIEVTDPELKDIVGNAKFSSITYRCAHCTDDIVVMPAAAALLCMYT